MLNQLYDLAPYAVLWCGILLVITPLVWWGSKQMEKED